MNDISKLEKQIIFYKNENNNLKESIMNSYNDSKRLNNIIINERIKNLQ